MVTNPASDYAASVVANAEAMAAAEELVRFVVESAKALGFGDDPVFAEGERLLRDGFGKGRPS